MFGKKTRLVSAVIVALAVTACEKPDDSRKITIEERLVQSFSEEPPETRQQIAEIIRAAQGQDYQTALNRLALLSASRILTKNEKFAVESIVRKLRFDMEEEIFSKQKKQKEPQEPQEKLPGETSE